MGEQSRRRAKIIGTVGPSSSSIDVLEKLIHAGLNVVRINMGHGTQSQHRKIIKNTRLASARAGQEVAILMDLQGPKIRTGSLDKALKLKEGDEWYIGYPKDNPPSLRPKRFIPTGHKDLVSDCRPKARILFDDGQIVAEAVAQEKNLYKIKIKTGGTLKSNKGINMPDCEISAPALTHKDKQDLLFGLEQGIDYVALSFVKHRKDVEELKFFLHKLKKDNPVIAKIETPRAIENIDEILDIADALMVARGDMGVELGNHQVPRAQKNIISICNERQKPVITATQMLESMTEKSTPTRAEASDVANAIWDGTDALMLSGETAMGKYPVKAVEMMGKIIVEAEKSPKERPLLRNIDLSSINASVMVAASMVAEKVGAKKILAVTESGHSCQRISMFRPQNKVLGITVNIEVARRLALYWGITPYYVQGHEEEDVDLSSLIEEVKSNLDLKNGDRLIITSGDGKFFTKGNTNSVKVEVVKDRSHTSGVRKALEEVDDGHKRILLDTHICAGCQSCVRICPHDIWAIGKDDDKYTYINKDKVKSCTLDMECIRVCPTGAIEIIPVS